MIISHTTYTELPTPLEVVRAALRNRELWVSLPTGADRAGELWRWGEELYRVVLREDQRGLTIEATPLVGRALLRVAIGLHEAGVATHATITITLDTPSAFWRRWALRRGLEQRARLCLLVLRRFLWDDSPQRHGGTEILMVEEMGQEQPSPAALADQLRERYPQTVAAFEEMGALDHLERVVRLERGWQRIAAGTFDASFYEERGLGTGDGRRGIGGQGTGDGGRGDRSPNPQSPIPNPQSPQDYDLIYAGGGLGLLHAAVMARKGWRVLLFDRGEVGCAHREWNISRVELAALVDLGLVTWGELAPIIMREYRTGLVRFHSGPRTAALQSDLWLPGVLDVALDAGALLRLMRCKLEEAGGGVLDGRGFRRAVVEETVSTKAQRHGNKQTNPSVSPYLCGESSPVRVELENLTTGAEETYSGRLLLDGMGSASPLALLRQRGRPFAGVCPTVGTVAAGFVAGTDDPRHHDATLGDILITVADSQRGQQYMWEGFPGREDELTVYLFYYDTARREVGGKRSKVRGRHTSAPLTSDLSPPTVSHSLLALFEDYFALLPSYKLPGADFRHLKPVYGYIPARHSLRRQEAPLLRGVLPVGDSAAQQSPLTFCGFGSHVRNLARTTGLLDYALQAGLTAPEELCHISAFQANVSLNWVFSRFMHPWGQPHDVNQLQNIFLALLNELGYDLAARFFQDRMRWSDYHKMVLGMFKRHPPIVAIAWRVLGPAGCRQWVGDYLRFSAEALLAAVARVAGRRAERSAERLLDALSPRRALALRARYAEWRAMGWVDEGQC